MGTGRCSTGSHEQQRCRLGNHSSLRRASLSISTVFGCKASLTSLGIGLNLHITDGCVQYYRLARKEAIHSEAESPVQLEVAS
jgi:hypothetical protein